MLIQSFIGLCPLLSLGPTLETPDYEFLQINITLSIVSTGEKKKTKAIDNELNPVWNEVSAEFQLTVMCESYSVFTGK